MGWHVGNNECASAGWTGRYSMGVTTAAPCSRSTYLCKIRFCPSDARVALWNSPRWLLQIPPHKSDLCVPLGTFMSSIFLSKWQKSVCDGTHGCAGIFSAEMCACYAVQITPDWRTFEMSRSRWHGCLCLVNIVCCQVDISATGRLLVRWSRTEWSVAECELETPTTRGPGAEWGCCDKSKQCLRWIWDVDNNSTNRYLWNYEERLLGYRLDVVRF
jgi:hypothetical protein